MLPALASDCLIARWNNCQSHKTNAPLWHGLLDNVGARLEYRILGREELASFAGKLNVCLRYLKGKYTLFFAEQVKASELSAETDQEGVYSTPLVDWHIPQEQVLKLRCVLSRTKAFWQTYHLVLEKLTTEPFAEASAACSEKTKRRIKELNPKLPEHARLLPFYKCNSAQIPDNVILEPLSAPSVFNPEVKVTAFRWGLTMILQIRKECMVPFQVLVVEGINDGFLNSIQPGILKARPSNSISLINLAVLRLDRMLASALNFRQLMNGNRALKFTLSPQIKLKTCFVLFYGRRCFLLAMILEDPTPYFRLGTTRPLGF